MSLWLSWSLTLEPAQGLSRGASPKASERKSQVNEQMSVSSTTCIALPIFVVFRKAVSLEFIHFMDVNSLTFMGYN